MKWKSWLWTLATTAITAAANGLLLALAAPELQWTVIGKAVGIAALTSVAHILRESPLPRTEWSEAERMVKLDTTPKQLEARAEKLEAKAEVVEKLGDIKDK